MPVFLALGRLIQKYRELKTGLSYIMIPFHKNKCKLRKINQTKLTAFPDT